MNQEPTSEMPSEEISEVEPVLAEDTAMLENAEIIAVEDDAEVSEMPEEPSLLNESIGETLEIGLEEPEILPEISIRELAENRWSVISADDCAAISLSYPEAEKLVKQLHKSGISGLCIVTDETAGRMLRNLIQNF